MTRTTFKSSLSPETHEIHVNNLDGKNVHMHVENVDRSGMIAIAQSDAPALALAILEAAGVRPFPHDVPVFYNDSWLESIANDLSEHVTRKEIEAAEAKEQAELEAEALELFNAPRAVSVTWEDMHTSERTTWLAVARRAREMAERAEK